MTRRRLAAVAVLVFLVAAIVAARYVLVVFAADLFVGVVQQVAMASGFAVEFDSEPVVGAGSFDAGAVRVRSNTGRELLHAESLSGSAKVFFHAPWLGVSLHVRGATVTVESDEKAPPTPWKVPEWPAMLSDVVLENAQVNLGQGRMLRLSGEVAPGGGGAVQLAFSGLGYSEESGERAAEDLGGSLTLQLPAAAPSSIDPQLSAGVSAAPVQHLDVEIRVASGAALFGPVLLDFSVNPLTARASVSPRSDGGHELAKLSASLGRLLAASGSMKLTSAAALVSADLVVSSERLSDAFVALVREPFGGVLPALAEATLQGRGQVQLRASSLSRHRTSATVSLTISALETRALDIQTLRVELPWIGSGMTGAAPRKGMLRAASVRLLNLPWTGVDLALASTAGRIRAIAPQTWKAVGGSLSVTEFGLEDNAKSGWRLAANLSLKDFDLGRLGAVYGIERLAGTLRGDLGRVTIDSSAIRASGGLEVAAFGGTVGFSGLRVEDPFGRVPSFGLNANLAEVSLEAVTNTLGVGRVTGVLEGHVSNLEVAAGQPVSFDADLHTVERRGVSQMVDVRAIVQLGVLGGGDGGSITGTLLKVFDRYRYSALGLRCRLRNDTFEVRGVESSKGKDYIVKGSLLPPTVSVVSHSQVISFSEMLRRIQRIADIGEGGSTNAHPD